MTQKQMEYFEAVCDSGNISAAADKLYVSRSVLSRAVSDLETEFDTSFFSRSKNGVKLTESGEILRQFFASYSASSEAVKSRIRQLKDEKFNETLHVGVTPTTAYCVHSVYLSPFRDAQPQVKMIIDEFSAYDAFDLLSSGKLDVFFTPVKPDSPGFASAELYPNPTMLGVSDRHPLALKRSASMEDILNYPIAIFNSRAPFETILKTCAASLGREANIAVRTSDQMLLRELTEEGKVIALLPLDMMAIWEKVVLLPVDFFPSSTNRMVWCESIPFHPIQKLFMDFMRDQIAQI